MEQNSTFLRMRELGHLSTQDRSFKSSVKKIHPYCWTTAPRQGRYGDQRKINT
jgi:hypothetical protein